MMGRGPAARSRRASIATGKEKTLIRARTIRRGFTLLELMLVLLILALLAGVGIVAFSGVQEKSEVKITRVKIQTDIAKALDLYRMDIGHYPTEAEGGLQALRTKPQFEDESLAEKWSGPYLREEPKDAWGQPFNYEVVEDTGESGGPKYKVWSNGPDRQSNTDDDIKSWSEEEEAGT